MTVFLGNAGVVRLRRSTPERTFTSEVNSGDIDTSANRFSFDFPAGMLLTGDLLQIKRVGAGDLTFIAASGWEGNAQLPDGNWYINVDELGGICLYQTFQNALAGGSTGKVSLAAISASTVIEIEVTSVQADYRILGLVQSFELNNDREVVDVTALSDEFRTNKSGLVSGNGSIQCQFHYKPGEAGLAGDVEIAGYLHELILRQKLGAEFDAQLFIVETGQNESSPRESLYFDFKGIVVNAAISLEASSLTTSSFQFVTTGEINMRLGTPGPGFLLKEDADKVLLEQPGDGKLELEYD